MVDAHHHLWWPDRGYRWLEAPELAAIRRPYTVADLRAALAGTGVRHTVLVEAGRCHLTEVPEHLGIAAGTPEIAGVVSWAGLTTPGLPDLLAGYRVLPGAAKLVGIRDQVQGQPDPAYLNRPEVRRGIAAVGAAGLAFDLVVRVDQLPAATATAAALPEVRFVLDHLGKPQITAGAEGLAEWRAAIGPLAARPNVTAKLSGLVSEADRDRWTVDDLRPYVTTAVELFGPDRLMFGSDWPVCTTAAGYRRVLDALRAALPPLSGSERAAVFGGTAITTYRLEIP